MVRPIADNEGGARHLTLLLAATRCRASINASHVVAAWELTTDVT